MLYVVIAKDGTDEQAPARRAAVRAAHLENARRLQDSGRLVTGGALLDEQENMIGSMMIVDVASEDEARELVANDVYSAGEVWQEVQIWPYRKAL
ncbi:MAG: YciI family protein [Trueperaceae bacterium]